MNFHHLQMQNEVNDDVFTLSAPFFLSSLISYQSAITKYYHSIIQYTTTSNVFLLSESIKYAKCYAQRFPLECSSVHKCTGS